MANTLGSFWNKLKVLFRPERYNVPTSTPTYQVREPSIPAVPPMQQGPLTVEEKLNVIAEAGRRIVMLDMWYDGKRRLVEPYSLRAAKCGDTLFMGYCMDHAKIHSFRIEKIEKITITKLPFTPRWPVEFQSK